MSGRVFHRKRSRLRLLAALMTLPVCLLLLVPTAVAGGRGDTHRRGPRRGPHIDRYKPRPDAPRTGKTRARKRAHLPGQTRRSRQETLDAFNVARRPDRATVAQRAWMRRQLSKLRKRGKRVATDRALLKKLSKKYGERLQAVLDKRATSEETRALGQRLVAEVAAQVALAQENRGDVDTLAIVKDATGDNPSPGALAKLKRIAKGSASVTAALGMLYLFLAGVDGIGAGTKMLGAEQVNAFFQASSNPVVGLSTGLLATAIMQSSSATTSMIVGMVAAGALGVPEAIPMIMGANIGTSVTNTFAALTHAGDPKTFEPAFAAATVHDMFNLLTVAMLLPLEVKTGFLQKTSGALAQWITGNGIEGVAMTHNPIKDLLKCGVEPIKALAENASTSPEVQSGIVIGTSALLMAGGLIGLTKLLKSQMGDKVKAFLQHPIQKNPIVGMATGAGGTMLVQSSSITTSVMVPLAAVGALTLAQVFPITLGANMGTTFTALMAATVATGVSATAALQIALVHTLFNAVGTALIYPVKAIRNIPLAAARTMAKVSAKHRTLAAGWVLGTFFALPAGILFHNQMTMPRTAAPVPAAVQPADALPQPHLQTILPAEAFEPAAGAAPSENNRSGDADSNGLDD